MGSKRRDKIPCYADTPSVVDIEEYKDLLRKRVAMGFDHYKMDLQKRIYGHGKTDAFAGQSITDKGYEYMSKYIEAAREIIGWDKPLGADHWGYMTVDDGIRLGKAVEPYSLAYIEDVIHWQRPNSAYLNKLVTEGSPTPTLHGEDLFGFDEFRPWIEQRSCDIIHPDMETSGGIIETKKIADYANMHGIPVMFHFAGSPVGCLASVHCAALVDDFISMENHAIDTEWWGDLVTGVEKPIINKGYITVPETPGIGVELNDDVVKEHLIVEGYFEPTTQFDLPMVGQHFGVPVDAIKK
mgnify:FL=1